VKDIKITVAGERITENLLCRLQDCSRNHEGCPKPRDASLPTRVIDVLHSNDDRIMLHISGPEECGQYLALSYRWGGPQTVTTTKATLSDRICGIQVSDLPSTLRDAVSLTRDLGYRYLWVDALCIVQDDYADKLAEICRMSAIYKNSTITIAAGSTNSVEESFLADRPIKRSCTFPYLLPDGSLGTLWIADCRTEVLQSPLDMRAWALQESLLSPRVLWYGPADLKWKCFTNAFDSVSKGHPHNFVYLSNRLKRLPPQIYHGSIPSQTFIPNEASELWCRILEDYSGRDVTFEEDRLPALSGIVSELKNLWGMEYYAGIWGSWLIRHLGWYNTAEAEDLTTLPNVEFSKLHLPPTHSPPSWSWVAYNARVNVYEVLDEYAQVLECTVSLTDSSDPLGRILGGRLVLSTGYISEAERLISNFHDSWFAWDYDHCYQQDKINPSFVYAYLGQTATMGSLALILVPRDDSTFSRIGILFSFAIDKWPKKAMEKRSIVIV